jgi:hypothetical protein
VKVHCNQCEEEARGRKLVTCKWVFKLKKNLDESILKYKIWLIAQSSLNEK